jgi:hypothetical protein
MLFYDCAAVTHAGWPGNDGPSSLSFSGIFCICIEASAMEFTGGFVIETTDGVLVGFALASPSFKASAGNCIFMLLPALASVCDTRLGVVLSELKVAGQHSWHRESEAIVIRYEGTLSLTITYGGVVFDGQGDEIGKAKPLPQ